MGSNHGGRLEMVVVEGRKLQRPETEQQGLAILENNKRSDVDCLIGPQSRERQLLD